MSMLTGDMKRGVREQRLADVATVCADIRSPGTAQNLATHPGVEVNVVDPIARKGYRVKGTGTFLVEGEVHDAIAARFRERDGRREFYEYYDALNRPLVDS